MLTLTQQTVPSGVEINIDGELTMETAKELAAVLSRVPATASHVILDCADLSFLDSTGVGTLILFMLEEKAAPVTLELCGLRPEVREVLDVLGFLDFLAERQAKI